MAFDIAIGKYHNADSVIHRLDPRTKLNLFLIMLVSTFLANGYLGLSILFAILLVGIILSSVPPKTILKAFAPVSFLLFFPLFFNLFFIKEGEVLFQWGFILVTDESLFRAGFMTLRLLLMFLSATILTLCTSPISLCDATAVMLRPFRRFGVPSYEISMMISIAIRFIPTLLEDFDHILKSQRSRGAVFDRGGPIARAKSLLPCIIPLFAQSFRHAEELALAMESRCYHGGENRTHYHVLKYAPRDFVALAICLAAFVALIIWL